MPEIRQPALAVAYERFRRLSHETAELRHVLWFAEDRAEEALGVDAGSLMRMSLPPRLVGRQKPPHSTMYIGVPPVETLGFRTFGERYLVPSRGGTAEAGFQSVSDLVGRFTSVAEVALQAVPPSVRNLLEVQDTFHLDDLEDPHSPEERATLWMLMVYAVAFQTPAKVPPQAERGFHVAPHHWFDLDHYYRWDEGFEDSEVGGSRFIRFLGESVGDTRRPVCDAYREHMSTFAAFAGTLRRGTDRVLQFPPPMVILSLFADPCLASMEAIEVLDQRIAGQQQRGAAGRPISADVEQRAVRLNHPLPDPLGALRDILNRIRAHAQCIAFSVQDLRGEDGHRAMTPLDPQQRKEAERLARHYYDLLIPEVGAIDDEAVMAAGRILQAGGASPDRLDELHRVVTLARNLPLHSGLAERPWQAFPAERWEQTGTAICGFIDWLVTNHLRWRAAASLDVGPSIPAPTHSAAPPEAHALGANSRISVDDLEPRLQMALHADLQACAAIGEDATLRARFDWILAHYESPEGACYLPEQEASWRRYQSDARKQLGLPNARRKRPAGVPRSAIRAEDAAASRRSE